AAVMAVLLARRGHAVATQHFIEPGRLQSGPFDRRLRGVGHRFMNSRLQHVIAVSRAVAEAAHRRGDVPLERLTVVLNGIAEPAGHSAADGDAVRASLGIPTDAPLVVCAARLEPEKDVATLVRAMREVASAIPQVRCVITGDGSQRPLLEEQIKRAGLAGTVRLTGFRPDATAIIAAGDVFVMPSLAEPFGLVLLEAMALGKATVVTRAGGPTEIVVDRETGLLTPPAAPATLAAAIVALLQDPPRREAMGRRGRERYARCFTADRMARETVAVYRRVLRLPDIAAKPDELSPNLIASP
ncbi:MAG: glycosyltransferase family 4 protein, partial [Gluconacetobacter diazotrophicus]|nr:glycosyltransferase family 4 protein [Gluconacetobacter diazotrophicus]